MTEALNAAAINVLNRHGISLSDRTVPAGPRPYVRRHRLVRQFDQPRKCEPMAMNRSWTAGRRRLSVKSAVRPSSALRGLGGPKLGRRDQRNQVPSG